jgi:hypothetical protein
MLSLVLFNRTFTGANKFLMNHLRRTNPSIQTFRLVSDPIRTHTRQASTVLQLGDQYWPLWMAMELSVSTGAVIPRRRYGFDFNAELRCTQLLQKIGTVNNEAAQTHRRTIHEM